MMSNALCPSLPGPLLRGWIPPFLAAAGDAQTAPVEVTGVPPVLGTLAAVGLCVLVVWIVRRIAHPRKAWLRSAPGRPNVVGPLHVLAVWIAMWLVSGAYYLLSRQLLLADMADGPAKQAADERLQIASGAVGGVVWAAAGLFVAAQTFRHGLLRGLGLSGRRWLYDTARGVLAYLAVLPVCVGLALAVVYLFRLWGIQPKYHVVLTRFRGLSIGWKVLSVLAVVVVAPVAEEIFFRGLIQSMIRRWTRNPWTAIAGASGLFALFHLTQPQAIPSLFALAVALGYNYERTGRLYAPILIHALFNAVNVWVCSGP